MSLQDFSKDSLNDIISGSVHGNGGEIPLQPEIDCEGTRFMVEA